MCSRRGGGTMSASVATLMSRLKHDPWRHDVPFDSAFAAFHERLLATRTDSAAAEVLNQWLASKHQPCLFARLAAKMEAVTFCILRDVDLIGPDDTILAKVQEARLRWSRLAHFGKSSAFVLIAISSRISEAIPDNVTAELAQRLGFLYLRTEIELDKIYSEEICLEMPGEERLTRLWKAGVNVFSAQGDGRWWRDHRIPGGLAFSMNSVGHLVRSGRMQRAFDVLKDDLGITARDGYRIDTLEKALEFALRTIDQAAPTSSGRATELLPLPEGDANILPQCPVQLPGFLKSKNHCEYHGWYDTDVTLPSVYFEPDVERPAHVPAHRLDFTYLFHRDVDNSDYDLIADGRRIRMDTGRISVSDHQKIQKARETVVRIEDTQVLRMALEASEGGSASRD